MIFDKLEIITFVNLIPGKLTLPQNFVVLVFAVVLQCLSSLLAGLSKRCYVRLQWIFDCSCVPTHKFSSFYEGIVAGKTI